VTHPAPAHPGLDIRPAEFADGPAVVNMWMTLQRQIDSYPPAAFGAADEDSQLETFVTMFEHSLEMESSLMLVSTLDDTVVGTLSIYITERSGYADPATALLVSVWVNPEQRRLGIASKMLEMARRWAKSQDVISLQVGWHPANQPASEFWRAQGFAGYEVIAAQRLD